MIASIELSFFCVESASSFSKDERILSVNGTNGWETTTLPYKFGKFYRTKSVQRLKESGLNK